MTTTQRAATVAVLLLIVAVAGFLLLRRSDTPVTLSATTATTTTGTDTTGPTTAATATAADTTTTTTAVPTATVTDPDDPTTTTTTTAPTVEPDGGDEPATTATTVVTVTDPDDPEKCVPASTTVQMPSEPDEWWTYDPELEWPVTDRDTLTTEVVYPEGLIEDAVGVARQVEGFWAWYMTWGHCQGAALDLHQADHRVWLAGDAVDQLMYAHHRFWQQRLPVWQNVWNREFETARDGQRNKLIYLDSLGALSKEIGVSGGSIRPSSLLYNPSDETSVWRYWGPIIRPVPNPTTPQRSGEPLPDDLHGACGPDPDAGPLPPVSWDCAHLGPAEDTALGDWDLSWYYDIPHEHAAWYVNTESEGLVRYDPDVHGAPTSQFGQFSVDGGSLMYLSATVADGAGWADIAEALKPYRPEGFPSDPDAYREMWRHDVGGGWWHKEMGQLVLLVPAAELVAWLEANGYNPQQMFAQGWPNPEEELLIRNTWGKDWDRDNPADWRNRLADGVGWLEQGVEIGDSGNLAADIEAAIHISAWMDWAYRARISGDLLPKNDLTGGWYPSAWAPGATFSTAQDAAEAVFGHRPDGWATTSGVWQGLYHQALADGYHPNAATGRLTHPALNPELAVWKEWAAAGEAERLLGFQAADGDLGPAPGDTWIPWYPEEMVPLENHYLLPEHSVPHWETVVDWWPEGGLETPVHQPDWYHAFTVAGPYVAEAGGHMFETCLWATGGLFAAWSLPHPQLEDASQNVTWIVRGIADRSGRVVKLAEPVNRPCIPSVNRWQHEGQIPYSHSGVPNFEGYMEYLRTPIHERLMELYYDLDTGLWTTDRGHLVAVPAQLLDNSITVHEADWLRAIADAADSEPGGHDGSVLEPSYEDWQQWETAQIETLRINYGGPHRDLPTRHNGYVVSEWLADRQAHVEGAADLFDTLSEGAALDTPARYTDWVLGGARSYPEEFMRSTYRIVSRHRQPAMHWMYNDGTAVNVDTWNLPQSEWDRWAARRDAETLHTGVLITPQFVQRWETDRTIPAGHISGEGVHNDWSWANVEMLLGSVDPDGAVVDDTPVWTVYLTSCMEEGFPTFFTRNGWKHELFTGFAPEASDSPVWAWPGVLTYLPAQPTDEERTRVGWPRWTWGNHPDTYLAQPFRASKLPPADCAGIAAGNYTPDYIHPYPGIGNYPVWMSSVGDRPPESWFVKDSPFDE